MTKAKHEPTPTTTPPPAVEFLKGVLWTLRTVEAYAKDGIELRDIIQTLRTEARHEAEKRELILL